MNRRTMLKLPAALAALFAPAIAIAGPELLRARQIHVDRLFRRHYDGQAPLAPATMRAFVQRASWLAIDDFERLATIAVGHTIVIRSGRRMRAYDEALQDIPAPPYYLWCRCSVTLPERAIKDKAFLQALARAEGSGLLPHTYI